MAQMTPQRQYAVNALIQVENLERDLQQALDINQKQESYKRIVTIFTDAKKKVWPLLRDVQFTDIGNIDQCVEAFKCWNNLLCKIVELIKKVDSHLGDLNQNAPNNQACSDIREFMKMLPTVVTRIVEHLANIEQLL